MYYLIVDGEGMGDYLSRYYHGEIDLRRLINNYEENLEKGREVEIKDNYNRTINIDTVKKEHGELKQKEERREEKKIKMENLLSRTNVWELYEPLDEMLTKLENDDFCEECTIYEIVTDKELRVQICRNSCPFTQLQDVLFN